MSEQLAFATFFAVVITSLVWLLNQYHYYVVTHPNYLYKKHARLIYSALLFNDDMWDDYDLHLESHDPSNQTLELSLASSRIKHEIIIHYKQTNHLNHTCITDLIVDGHALIKSGNQLYHQPVLGDIIPALNRFDNKQFTNKQCSNMFVQDIDREQEYMIVIEKGTDDNGETVKRVLKVYYKLEQFNHVPIIIRYETLLNYKQNLQPTKVGNHS